MADPSLYSLLSDNGKSADFNLLERDENSPGGGDVGASVRWPSPLYATLTKLALDAMGSTVIAILKRLKFVVIFVVVLTPSIVGSNEDRMVLGPRQFEYDKSGQGAVLCVWAIYLSVKSHTAVCGLARRPVDDAIDNAIAKIDEFIIANSSLHPSRAALEDFKRRAAEQELKALGGQKTYCEGPGARDIEGFRSTSADEVQKSVTALLAVPREPVMNPCL
jgi:hypothetical protein